MNTLKLVKRFGGVTNMESIEGVKRIFWGVAPTGDIHIGYFPYMAFLSEAKKAGHKIILFIGDFHGYWDGEKTKYQEIEVRTNYYINMFKKFGFEDEDIDLASKIYFKKDYINLLFQFSNHLPNRQLLEYADKTLKNESTGNYSFADMLYVATQIIDVAYYDLDVVLSGKDESGIYELGLPIADYFLSKKVNYVYFDMVQGVISPEMHASNNSDNKITLHEDQRSILLKLSGNDLLYKSVNEYILPMFGISGSEDKTEVAQLLYNICNGRY